VGDAVFALLFGVVAIAAGIGAAWWAIDEASDSD
jgi:hypothetical protein